MLGSLEEFLLLENLFDGDAAGRGIAGESSGESSPLVAAAQGRESPGELWIFGFGQYQFWVGFACLLRDLVRHVSPRELGPAL
jgi:hypothetical protein